MSVGAVSERSDRKAFVRFEKVPIEDKAASLEKGHYVAKDVDFALITPPYSRDVVRLKVTQWKLNMEQDVRNGRFPEQWMEENLKAYAAWQRGEEIPLSGIPIKGWGVISPAQQETLLRMNILTVEDLAGINGEGLQRIGMGAVELKNKATAWLQQLKDKGPLTMEMAALKTENAGLKSSVESLQMQVAQLVAQMPRQLSTTDESTETESISANDILPEPETTTTKLKKK